MSNPDFSFLSLTHAEHRTLKKSQSDGVPVELCERLMRHHLVQEERQHTPGSLGTLTGQCRITDLGNDYLVWIAQQRKSRRWEIIRYWITTSIALAALVKAFLPELSAATAWLLKLLKR